MTTSTRRNLEWVENHEIMARRGDRDALAALKVFSVVASGKPRLAARQAVQAIEAEVDDLTFAVDAVEAPAAPFSFDEVTFAV